MALLQLPVHPLHQTKSNQKNSNSSLTGRAGGACLFFSASPAPIPLSRKMRTTPSDQSGFLPIFSSFSCLLIYARQQRLNCATRIFPETEKYEVG
jgi:hypothetical protein